MLETMSYICFYHVIQLNNNGVDSMLLNKFESLIYGLISYPAMNCCCCDVVILDVVMLYDVEML